MNRHQIIGDLKKRIARGIIEPGDRLVESHLCNQYNVGRGKVREALRQLEIEEFIRIVPNAGAIVVELSQKDIEQIYDLLGALEGLAIRVATPVIEVGEIKKIEKLITRMETTNDRFRFYKINFEFHCYVDSLSGNNRLIRFSGNLRVQANRFSLRSFYNPGQIKASIQEHRKILDAVKDGNPLKAEKMVRDHYLNAKNRLVKFINRSL